ncbi:MAG TPA: cob(I)yrinic acid a,c-diamide adenosyltransferase [Chromatiaceae bacterium]|nr:cob(I)yrinic acid a,c-diamide adenosyltransferase [Chromatiaceae bacterium]
MARLTRIVTRSGDTGQTGLGDGQRVDKTSPRIAALGDLDELIAALGLITVNTANRQARELIEHTQQQLFDLGGELAVPGSHTLAEQEVGWLEHQLEQLNQTLPPLQEFLLPGGNAASAHAQLARAICRRAERSLWRLSRTETLNSTSLKYINRLSDLLFVLARTLARQTSEQEQTWNKER